MTGFDQKFKFRTAFRALVPAVLPAVVLFGIVLMGSVAFGQSLTQKVSRPELQSLINKIERLQREMSTVQQQVYRSSSDSGSSGGTAKSAPIGQDGPSGLSDGGLAATMQVRLDEIETQMRGFTGKIEELNHDVDGINAQMKKLVSDMEFRIKALETRLSGPVSNGATPSASAVPPQMTPSASQPGILGTIPLNDLNAVGVPGKAGGQPTKTVALPAAKILPKGTPEEQYKHATGLLFQTDYVNAERALSAFVVVHPKHKLAGNAQYWLGETHYVRKNYRNAAQVFAEGYQKYPKSAKSADNLLKLGMSLGAMGKKKSACATFKRLVKEFSKAAKRIKSRVGKQRKKLRCR
ncbi:MAG: tol-pal system protein YbgF [Alphaproteobacteria bacterium]